MLERLKHPVGGIPLSMKPRHALSVQRVETPSPTPAVFVSPPQTGLVAISPVPSSDSSRPTTPGGLSSIPGPSAFARHSFHSLVMIGESLSSAERLSNRHNRRPSAASYAGRPSADLSLATAMSNMSLDQSIASSGVLRGETEPDVETYELVEVTRSIAEVGAEVEALVEEVKMIEEAEEVSVSKSDSKSSCHSVAGD